MKNIDDLIKAKTAAIETKQVGESHAAEQEVLQNSQSDLAELTNNKKQLELVRESLSMEESGRTKAKTSSEKAEEELDAKVPELENVGISKEDLLKNPDYADYDVVIKNSEASEEVALYSTPSVGSEELNKKLVGLGVELPDSEYDEKIVGQAIEARLVELNDSILETKLQIPEERESVVKEIITTHKIKSGHIDLRRDVSSHETNGSFKDVAEGLENQFRYIPIVQENPELKKAIIEAVITESILSKSEVYQEQQAKRTEHDKKVAAYAEVEAKLPEYVEALNTNLLDPLHEHLSKLDKHIANAVLANPEFKAILDTYTFDGQWGNEASPRKITDLKLDGVAPTVAQMKKHLASKPWDTYQFERVLKTLEGLAGMSYDDFKEINRDDMFQGYLKEISQELVPHETVPKAERLTDYQEWDRGFAEMEYRARDQASRLTNYVALKEEFDGNDISEAGSEHKKITAELAQLGKAGEELSSGGSNVEFRFGEGRVINATWEERGKGWQEKLIACDAKILQIDESLQSLGQRPTGLFSKKKGEEWDNKKARLEFERKSKDGEKETTDNNIKNYNEDWTSRLSLPEDITKIFEGRSATVSEVRSALYEKSSELRAAEMPLGEAVRKKEFAASKLTELEKSRFYFEDTSYIFPN